MRLRSAPGRARAGAAARATGTSLWLVPDEETGGRYRRLIARLAGQLGTPVFEPHVTLVAGLAAPPEGLLDAAPELAAQTASFDVRLTSVGGAPDFFRCLFLEVGASTELRRLRERACGRFGVPAAPFRPHLSLVYGRLDAARRGRLASDLAGEAPRSLGLRALDVVSTTGAVEEWRRLSRAPLGPAATPA